MKLFSVLSKEEIEFVEKNSKKIRVAKNEIVYSIKDEIRHVSLVLSGKLKVVKFSIDGNQQIVNHIVQGNTFGEALVFSKKSYPAYVIAEENSTILMVPRQVIFKLFDNKKFLLFYIESMSTKVSNLSFVIEILSIKSIQKRLLTYFSILSIKQGSNVIFFKSKKNIADNIGTVREVVSRTMKNLEEKGLIEMIDLHHLKFNVDVSQFM